MQDKKHPETISIGKQDIKLEKYNTFCIEQDVLSP